MRASGIKYDELLGKYHRFHVPHFQRSYNWMPKQVRTFWESILENDSGYFVGTLVCIQGEKDGHRLDVIDGQQRLTTLSLIMAAIRDYLEERDEKDKVEDIEKFLLFSDSFEEEKEPIPRLKYYKNNVDLVYSDIIFNRKHPAELDDNQKRFTINYNLISKLIKEYLDENHVKDLRNKIKNLQFVLIITPNDSDAYKLFEGLNSTGLQLSEVDLVKNGVLMSMHDKKASEKQIHATADTWEEMEKLFEEYNIRFFNKFIRHEWISKKGYITSSALYDEIKKEYLSSGKVKDIQEYVKELNNDASLYINLRSADSSLVKRKNEQEILEYLSKISLLGVDQVYEVLLSAHRRYEKDDKFTHKQYVNLLQFLWSFTLVTKYSTVSPSQYEREFAKLAPELDGSKTKDVFKKIITKYKSKLQKFTKNKQDEFEEYILENIKYGKDSELIRVLYQELFNEDDKTIKQTDPSVEHIVPKEPSKWNLDKESVNEYVNTLGNLTLLNDKENKIAQNKVFDEKYKEVFSKSAFKMNKELNEWSELFNEDPQAAVEQRGKDIARKIFNQHSRSLKS